MIQTHFLVYKKTVGRKRNIKSILNAINTTVHREVMNAGGLKLLVTVHRMLIQIIFMLYMDKVLQYQTFLRAHLI